jgi:hypothetical protein
MIPMLRTPIVEEDISFILEVGMPYATECRPRLAFGKKLDEQVPIINLN